MPEKPAPKPAAGPSKPTQPGRPQPAPPKPGGGKK